jgi:serine/threonine protein kinase
VKRNLPDATKFIGQLVPGREQYRIERLLGSGCNAHVFVAHSDSLVHDVACKVIPVANLVGTNESPPRWREEIHKANRVSSSRVVKCHDLGEWSLEGIDHVFLFSDFVQGESLRDYLKRVKIVDVGFIEAFVEQMLDFLRELQGASLQHGDLHDGNILVEDRTQSLVGPGYAFRITDFGVLHATTGEPLLDDFDQLATVLRDLLSRVKYPECSPRDRYVFDALNGDLLAKGLSEHDSAHDARARNPAALFASLQEVRKNYLLETAGKSRRTLITPFDYLSCEQIGESHGLLKELYSNKMLGLPAIEGINNLVLTGPRGCGKTTVYRSLSLKHLVHTDDDKPASLKYIGVYYRCDDLYFSFPRYQKPARSEALDVPMHFLSATLIRELVDSLALWLPRQAEADFRASEASVARELWDVLGLPRPRQPDVDTLASISRCLQKERDKSAKKQRFVNDPTHTFEGNFGPDVVPKVCTILQQRFEVLRDRPIFFFVDDYSTPKITTDLQRNLNRLVMQRTAACFFKIATESPASYANQDVDGKAYVEGREFTLVNLGIDFINADSDEKLLFVDDIFGRRFAYCDNYPVKTLIQLIGDEDKAISQNEVARSIRLGKYPVIWGRSALGELCSGDVHFLIELVGKMVASAGGRDALTIAGDTPAVAPAVQNKTIRAEALNFLRNLRALPVGQALVDVVEAFGAVASSYLRYRDAKNETSSPPHQACRIEPYEDPRLEGEARQVYEDLLRYSVFIEDVRGKSRRGDVVPRLYLRRFLVPSFNLTFSKRDSLQLSVADLHELLISPKSFQNKKRLKAPDEAFASDLPSPKGDEPAASRQLSLSLPDAPNPGKK